MSVVCVDMRRAAAKESERKKKEESQSSVSGLVLPHVFPEDDAYVFPHIHQDASDLEREKSL